MKSFVVIQTLQGQYFIRKNTSPFPKRQVIGEFDTYPEAKAFKEKQDKRMDEAKSLADDRWHAQWESAERHGDMKKLLAMSGANRY